MAQGTGLGLSRGLHFARLVPHIYTLTKRTRGKKRAREKEGEREGRVLTGMLQKDVRKSGEHAAALIYEHGPVAISASPPSPPIIERYRVNRDHFVVVTRARRNGEPVVEPVERTKREKERERDMTSRVREILTHRLWFSIGWRAWRLFVVG